MEFFKKLQAAGLINFTKKQAPLRLFFKDVSGDLKTSSLERAIS